MHDLALGGAVPYAWKPTGNHAIVVSGVTHDGNLLVHDTANIGPQGARPGAGRKPGPRKRLELDADTAKSLYQLTRLRRAALSQPDLAEEDVVKSLVDAEWEKVEGEMLPAEEAKDFII